ncbi:hypothetical protein KQ944_06735 [Bacillus subtilis]|nr:hypothetical protein [Bacillus subtilis]
MALIRDGYPYRKVALTVLKYSTLIGLGLGFSVSALSFLAGNVISINGYALSGWYGVWTVTLALGAAGFCFGLIWALVFKALGEAARR